MASLGDIVIYTNTATDRSNNEVTVTEWAGTVIEVHSPTDCSLALFACLEIGGFVTCRMEHKRCNEDAISPYTEGTWRLAT